MGYYSCPLFAGWFLVTYFYFEEGTESDEWCLDVEKRGALSVKAESVFIVK